MASIIKLRKAVKEDMYEIMDMIQELANFEEMPDGPKIEATHLIRDGFEAERPYFFAIVAEDAQTKKLVGYALCNFAYSSWLARSMYIEDIYVKPEVRKQGVGHKLFKEVCTSAVEHNVNRLDWHVLVDNQIARKFYDRHGAYDLCKAEGRTAYRLERDGIRDVASKD